MNGNFYTYNNLSKVPCLVYIEDYTEKSNIQKTIKSMKFNPTKKRLEIWVDELSSKDKTILDTIVNNSLGKKQVKEKSHQIIYRIFHLAEQQVQLPRLYDALDSSLTFIQALDGLNYSLAKLRVMKLLETNKITQKDYDLVIDQIPNSYINN